MSQIVYFKNLVNNEITKLVHQCDKWHDIITKADAPEEEKGNILAVIGQSNLLITEKFGQFTDLIQICEKNDGSQKITFDDLQGFWDLVHIQIEDVNNKFLELELKKGNKWRPLPAVSVESNNEVIRKKTRTKSNKAINEAAKLRLKTAKAAMQERLRNQN